jgi:hypothetical protein
LCTSDFFFLFFLQVLGGALGEAREWLVQWERQVRFMLKVLWQGLVRVLW